MIFSITPFGPWSLAEARIAVLPATIQRSIRWGEEKAARKLIKIVRGHIQRQDLSSFQSNPKVRPGHYSGSKDLLVDSATYYNAITYWKNNKVMNIGVKVGELEPNGVEIARVANWLEYGTSKMPPRPVWGPSIEELGGEWGIRGIVYDVLLSKLMREGWDIEIVNF